MPASSVLHGTHEKDVGARGRDARGRPFVRFFSLNDMEIRSQKIHVGLVVILAKGGF